MVEKHGSRVAGGGQPCKHGRDGSRCPVLTNRDLDPIVHTLSILVFEQSDQDLDQSRLGILIRLAHAWSIELQL